MLVLSILHPDLNEPVTRLICGLRLFRGNKFRAGNYMYIHAAAGVHFSEERNKKMRYNSNK